MPQDELIQSLERRIKDLTAEAAKYRDRMVRHRDELKPLKEELDKLRGVQEELDRLKAKAEAAPSEWQAKAEAAEAALRQRDHRDAWREAIGAELADKVTVEKVWAELKYEPGKRVPSADEIREKVQAAREGAPYLFLPAGETPAAPAGVNGQPARAPLQAGPGGSRGRPDSNATRFTVRRSDMRDPHWMSQHQQAYAEHARAGTLVVVD